ncbi:ATP diphosphatase [Alteromonadaceae bacterium Bs31]|nr:ATP diphosphatase [Alteromonadaceae bacterium Bs31]
MKPSSREKYTIDDLIYLMARLRDPLTGCPWDLKQDYRSITPSTIEEAYEVVDAIEQNDLEHLKEELGDFLFQVIFYAQLASEEQRWDFHDIVHLITAKLIRRHPHVFPSGSLQSRRSENEQVTDESIKASWEAIKQGERNTKGKARALDDVPSALPALQRAQKLQKRAAQVGFDWSEPKQVLQKLKEEIAELEQEIDQQPASLDHIQEELGDVLFSCVNLARHFKWDSEQVLRQANKKFETRFNFIETALEQKGIALAEANQGQMEELWKRAKQAPSHD